MGPTPASRGPGAHHRAPLFPHAQSLSTIDSVEVSLQVGSAICNATGAVTRITFLQDFGDLPPLRPFSFLSSTGDSPTVTVSEGEADTRHDPPAPHTQPPIPSLAHRFQR